MREGAPPQDRFKLEGLTLEGKFRIEKAVAEGGFAVVYRGVHTALERPVAVKVLKTPPEFNEEAREAFIERFAFEARTIAKVSHPSIVQVLDYGVSVLPTGEKAAWMALEWLTGHTLDTTLRARRGHGGRTPAEALALLKPVFEAMAYAHEEGIAHRDIKPANMILVPGRRGTTLRLLDFGIAKIMAEDEGVGSGHTQTQTVMQAFSPKYASPEQIGGTRTGPWTDIHALGLIVTEVLTDHTPYDGRDVTARFAEALSPTRPTPAKRGIDVGAWEAVLRRAVAVPVEERFANAGEFLAALEKALPEATHRPLASAAPATPSAPSGADTLARSAVETQVPRAAIADGADAGEARHGRRRGALLAALLGVTVLSLVGAFALRRGDVPATISAPQTHTITDTSTHTSTNTPPPPAVTEEAPRVPAAVEGAGEDAGAAAPSAPGVLGAPSAAEAPAPAGARVRVRRPPRSRDGGARGGASSGARGGQYEVE
ncbi:MAG: serine/threonine protein kinase [Deltaproteobacteria bacterium]|nr:serine/threonine protein kinase [Deltaproteobacteria bacterium]